MEIGAKRKAGQGNFYNLTDFINIEDLKPKVCTTVVNGVRMKTLDEMEQEFEQELLQVENQNKKKQIQSEKEITELESPHSQNSQNNLIQNNLKPRIYQETILGTCILNNTLVVLPTGLGKTLIAMLLATARIKLFPNSKILVLAPTRPLVEQHINTFKKHTSISDDEMVLFTGMVKPEKRAQLWKKARVIFSTPQGLENDVLSGKIKLNDVSLVVFDEAHRASGDYSYVFLAKKYEKQAKYPRVLGLTASPGSDAEKILEVCQNLWIDAVEVRTDEDADVKPYVQEVDINWIKVDFPDEFKKIQKFLQTSYKSKLKSVKEYGYVKSSGELSKTELLRLQGYLHSELSKGFKNIDLMKSVSLIAEAMKIQHAIELLETQGISALQEYFMKLEQEAVLGKTKAAKNLAVDTNFKSAGILTRNLYSENVEHPKVEMLLNIIQTQISKNSNHKMIVFNQFRDSASKIKQELDKKGISNEMFFGQAKKKGTGLSQKEQKKVLDRFREGEFHVLISTSVGEEGLDIPKVDSVIFYEPVPSAIRTIQRRGRTGRNEKGSVSVMVTKGTRDEGYRWSAHHKEKRMHRVLNELKRQFKKVGKTKKETTLDLQEFISEKPIKISADHREKGNLVVKDLSDKGLEIELCQLKVGDYVLSNRVCVELKKVGDFVDSIIDGRLLAQVKQMKMHVERPVIIIEGDEDIYAQRKIHPNAIRGMIATIAISFGIPIIHTKNSQETAALLVVMAKREQTELGGTFNPHASRKPATSNERIEYIVSSLPGIGQSLVKPLLSKFKTIKNIVNADLKELKEVEKIGDKKAKDIQKVLTEEWTEKFK
ncbi:DEAD/DEAH box helicase [Candidatus Woesearchaeota archaeon]|jgi:ERCC4-related helicase|nr:DEAD/DEAH box helicase [Candidatus Woesearchaeota archaeon]MBT6520324.1 DEAD/DEAH box helicase [Candidatus Woesearchaeota archaeon]MBT7368277.1 DEAD/DEAH box helicase [Candidatus Woesearchaeota archaeon]